jgi:selenocysteine lyase/cysteine desulfurase
MTSKGMAVGIGCRAAQFCHMHLRLHMCLQVGLGVACSIALEAGMLVTWQRAQLLAQLLRNKLQEIPGVTVQDHGRQLCAIVSFTVVRSCPVAAVIPGECVGTHLEELSKSLLCHLSGERPSE